MDTIKTEIVVVGAGPGGYAAAFYAADLGKQVILIEREQRLGGVCLNRGCIPSKALLYATHQIVNARESAHRGITFESEKKPSEIAELMQQADCFLMFSNYESFSVVIAEALACGLPIIATDAGGISSELTKDYGIIIKPNDEAALQEAMIYMISHHTEYDKQLLSAYADKFSYENVGKSYYNLYQEILN